MIEYILAAAAGVLVYRELERWLPGLAQRVGFTADPTDEPCSCETRTGDRMERAGHDHLTQVLGGQLGTIEELLKLVQVLAVRSAEAEKAVSAVAAMTPIPVLTELERAEEAAKIEVAPAENQELNWTELPRDHAKKQQSALAEMLAKVQTPDGGTMVDP